MVKHAGKHPTRCALLGAALLACALGPASVAQARDVPADGVLSPRLAELARPAVRSGSPAEQAKAIGVAAEGPGSLIREGGRVVVEVRFGSGTLARLGGLRAAGGRVLAASRRLQTATVSIAPAALHELAAVGGVDEVGETRAPILYGGSSAAAVGAECEGGSVVSEGVTQLHAVEARSKYGVTGSGVTVGVLSDSYDQATLAADESGPVATHAGEDVASGDLPGAANACSGQKTPVNVIEDFAGTTEVQPTDEGRAMLQTVHDVAPAASLAFATAFQGEASFAQNIEKLAKPVGQGGAGAQVIVDDVAYFEEPFFQDGPIAAAVSKVAGEGVTYFSAAGNDNLFDAGGHEIASWEAPSFRDSSTCPATLLALPGFGGGHCMDFNPGAPTDDTFGITVAKGEVLTVDLQWAEPWHGDHTDLDAYLLDSKGNLLTEATSDNVGGTERPVELLQWENTGSSSKEVQLAVNRCSGSCNPAASGATTPRLKLALLENGAGVTETEYPTSAGGDTVGPTIYGHSGTPSAISVGAVRFSDGSKPERYSSRGPVTHYFAPVSGNSPAAPLGSPETIAKPDIAATDCGATTFFAFFVAEETTWRFCGTSAAAPHAAGVAALELQAKPSATVAQVRAAQTSTAGPVGSFGPNAVGAGLLNADGAVASLLPPAIVTITSHPPSRTSDSTPTFEFEANQPATFSCSVDGGAAQPCSSPHTTASLPDGSHTFEVDALEGQTVLDTASFSFTVDTSPPTVGFTKQPAAITADATPTFGFSASEPATFACSVDGAAPQSCGTPYTVPGALSDGPHTFEVIATDQAGNVGHAELAMVVDTVPPKVTFTTRPAAATRDVDPTFGFSSDEPAALACSLDDAQPRACASPFGVTSGLRDGRHTFEVTATDQAGNVGRVTATFTVDTAPPRTFFEAHPRKNIRIRGRRARAVFRFGSDSPGAQFICRVDGGLFHFCQAVIARRFTVGFHAVRVKAFDAAGNVDPTEAVYRFRVRRVGSPG